MDAANVVYLRTGLEWWRVTIDCGIVFWSVSTRRPARYSMPELDAEARIDDAGGRLGLAGDTIVACDAIPLLGGCEVRLRFRTGRVLHIQSVQDTTSVSVTGHCEGQLS